jgi:hypothetical protein
MPASPEPTDEQLEAAWQAVRPDYTVMDRRWTSNAQNAQVDRVARALAAAVAAEREKYEAVRKLHAPGLHGGLDVDLKVCEECDRTWPCDTVKRIREVSR